MTGPDAIDSYLAALSADKREALTRLRDLLRQELPGAEEVMSYAMPGFRLSGRMVAGYAAFARHLGFYPHSGTVIPRLAAEIDAQGFARSKSGVTFPPDRPLPDSLVRLILQARLAEAGLA